MDVNALLISMGSMGGMGALFALGLIFADIKLHVDEDPRIALVLDELPGANCGGCGYPGCSAFAERIVDGSASITACPVNTADGVAEIAMIMGVEAEAGEKIVARVLCKGGKEQTAKKGEYIGIKTCMAAHLTFGADRLCQYGCLGYGDCEQSCPFDAIKMDDNGLPIVDDEKCTGCGNCVTACPRKIIEIHPISRNLFVFCKNQDDAKYARSVCIKACNACKACVKAVDEGLIVMQNNLAVINYDVYGTVTELPTQKCPTGAIDLISHRS
ncbi:MAG: RnfABCDGE type electron transport complex subunit B [bacterium]